MKKSSIILILLWAVFGVCAQPSANFPKGKLNLEELGAAMRSQHMRMYYHINMKYGVFVVQDTLTGKQGIMNLKGEMVLPAKYDYVGFIKGADFFEVSATDTTTWVMNYQMERLPWPPQFINNFLFDEGWPRGASRETGKIGLVDQQGRVLIPFEHDRVELVDSALGWANVDSDLYDYRHQRVVRKGARARSWDGMIICCDLKSQKEGLLDTLGNWIVEPKYTHIENPHEGFATCSVYQQYGFIDMQGREAVPLKYDRVMQFSQGLAAVEQNGKWGYIDTQGRVVIPFEYDIADEFCQGGFAVVYHIQIQDKYQRKDTLKVIDTQGRVLMKKVIRGWLGVCSDTSMLWGIAKDDSVWGVGDAKYVITDLRGKVLCSYEEILFEEGEYYSEADMIAVKQNGKWGLADKHYNIIIPCKYRKTVGYCNGPGAIVTLDDGSTQYIDRQGKTLFKCDGFEIVSPVSKDLYKVLISSGKEYGYTIGLIDRQGHTTLSQEELRIAKEH